jgi:hypothetical protein
MNLVPSKSLGKESARSEFVEIAPRISNMFHLLFKGMESTNTCCLR